MPDFGRPDFRGAGWQPDRPGSGPQPGEPSLDAVRRTDGFIDALADARPVTPQDPSEAELAALLGNWRDELRWPPATGLLSEADVMAAFNAGRAQKRSGPDPQRWTDTRKRSRRSLSVIGASAAAVLCLGGFGAVVAGSGPGDALYGVRTMLFGGQKQVRDDQIGLAAKTELNQVQTLISQGDWQLAQDKLVAVSTQVATIDDQQQKQELLDQFNDLSAKVVERDPAATAPPGVVYTVAPSSAELVPAVEPTAVTSTSSTTSTPMTTPTTTAPPSSSSSAGPSTSSPAPTTTAPPAASTPAPSSSPASPAETSAAPQNQQTTTPTSAAPETAGASPSGAAPITPASPTSVGSSPQAPRAVSSTPAPDPTTMSQTPAEAPSPAAEGAPASAAESVPSAPVSTTLVPVPAGP